MTGTWSYGTNKTSTKEEEEGATYDIELLAVGKGARWPRDDIEQCHVRKHANSPPCSGEMVTQISKTKDNQKQTRYDGTFVGLMLGLVSLSHHYSLFSPIVSPNTHANGVYCARGQLVLDWRICSAVGTTKAGQGSHSRIIAFLLIWSRNGTIWSPYYLNFVFGIQNCPLVGTKELLRKGGSFELLWSKEWIPDSVHHYYE